MELAAVKDELASQRQLQKQEFKDLELARFMKEQEEALKAKS